MSKRRKFTAEYQRDATGLDIDRDRTIVSIVTERGASEQHLSRRVKPGKQREER